MGCSEQNKCCTWFMKEQRKTRLGAHAAQSISFCTSSCIKTGSADLFLLDLPQQKQQHMNVAPGEGCGTHSFHPCSHAGQFKSSHWTECLRANVHSQSHARTHAQPLISYPKNTHDLFCTAQRALDTTRSNQGLSSAQDFECHVQVPLVPMSIPVHQISTREH